MKITIPLIGVCLLPLLTGCHKPKPSELIGAAEAPFKTATLASITAKYPDISSSELEFSQMSIRTTPNGQEEVFVTYDLPASAKTTTEGKKSTTITKTIGARVSSSGEVEAVYESTRTTQHSD